jgi:hypothetical protein
MSVMCGHLMRGQKVASPANFAVQEPIVVNLADSMQRGLSPSRGVLKS